MCNEKGPKYGQVRPAACRRAVELLVLLAVLETGLGNRRTGGRHVEGKRERGNFPGDEVTIIWPSTGRTKREAGADNKVLHPDTAEIELTAEGKELVLEIERNQQLLSRSFTETYYDKNGEPVTITPNYTNHCFYHGEVRGHAGSWVVLSTCTGVRGLVVLNSNDSYYLEPRGGEDSTHHRIYRTAHLPVQSGSCGQAPGASPNHHLTDLQNLVSHVKPLHQRIKRDTWTTTKYMELFIVADYTLYQKQNRDYEKTKQRIIEIANYVDKFYRALNIRVPLIGLEVWTEGDQCTVREEPNATLWSFLQWKQKLKARKKHDNAQLLTGVTFKGTTIGMAPLEGMCSHENSGGINVDHSEEPIGAAATMAHEIGHNFGMSHDNQGCCVEATPAQGGCVMAAATGHPFPRVFSACSKKDLAKYFHKGGGMCLYNIPDMKDLVGGKRCGNGFVEDGEECDCGEPEECTNPCCNPNNCTLKAEAQCAHGVCCESCKLKEAGTMCREPAGACDLPEYCTGSSPYCPSNVYLLDGSVCLYGQAYCYNGMCLTHEQQCIELWGYGAQPAPDACFQDVNAAGNAYGNCGKDNQGNYVRCKGSDAKCGKIQCQSAAKKPVGTNAVSIDTTIRFNGREVKCRGTFVYATQDGEGDMPDPGLVMTGTKCGDGKICRERKCQNESFSELAACVSQCNGHGVCNSNKNCHCDPGWAPPFCRKPGLGGSVDSGPVQNHSQQGLVAGLLFTFLVILPGVLGLFYCYKVKTSPYHKWLAERRQKTKVCRKEASEEKTKNGQINPDFHLKIIGSSSNNAKKPSKTGQEILPLRPGPTVNGPHPVNIVRPLRPAPTPDIQRNVKMPRPVMPAGKPPPTPTKFTSTTEKLIPPKKPLPVNPTRTPLLAADLSPKQSSSPPQRPLPLNPSPARGGLPKRDEGLLVMMPPANHKPVGKAAVIPPAKPLKPKPSINPIIVPFAFRK
ncbi:disintegrin and metalloproteinase domain-containing protein 19 isoform X2 [Polypterus senegalus]|uniref:disintegrin and metalloproteinase domain-containing protein 19 isoform X2 n=1 Tax=Polypterus senegalus TaxID=55291 RepID=UPI0019626C99|nr:disintegrin and metalloproteinase domain-containing protein 19 isoform X2 [Polypterus senegalus]